MSLRAKITLCLLAFPLVWGVNISVVNAAQIFNKKEPVQAPLEPQEREILELLDEAPEITDTVPEKEPQTINDFANQYYKNCLRQDHPILKGESLEMMCGCTSAQIPDNMTVKQMKDMQENTADGQHQRSRMLLFVYTPCIQYPTKALIHDKCVNNPEVQTSMKHYKKVCECLSDGMAQFMKEKAPKYIQSSLHRNSADMDPLRTLMESRVFEEQSQYHMRKCVQTHEFAR